MTVKVNDPLRAKRVIQNDPIRAPKVRKNRNRDGQRGGRGPGETRRNPVTAIITPDRLRKEVRAATNLEYRPLERKLAGELRASSQRVDQLGNWWDEYLKEVSGLRTDVAGAYDQAAATTQNFINQASGIDNANTQRLDQQAAESAAVRGMEPEASSASREQAAQAQRNYLSAAYGASTAQQGANQYAYLSDKARIGAGQKIAARRDEQKRGLSIRQDQRELAKQRGEFATKYRTDLRDRERDYLIQLRAFRDKGKDRRLDARQGAADRALDEAQLRETERHNRETERNSREDNRRPGGKTPAERRDARADRRDALVTVGNLFTAAKQPPQNAREWAAFTQLVAQEGDVPPSVAKWAVRRFRRRHGY